MTAPLPTIPEGSGGFVIYGNLSKYGLGCVLMQVIVYASRQFKQY